MRFELEIRGIVQGVGFRPFICNLASSLSLRGYVSNSYYGVYIVVEASQNTLDEFVKNVRQNRPVLSEIESIKITQIKSQNTFDSFSIKESQPYGTSSFIIPPDIAMCESCQEEMEDETNRRYEYPFISCVNCGPRFSVIKSLPYDRDKTSMSEFELCETCQEEYENPKDRRYHAQTTCCKDCGVRLSLLGSNAIEIKCANIVEEASSLIAQGKILAIKGVGGYHLVCDATNDATVRLLRERKRRGTKPFAVMVKSLDELKKLSYVSKKEESLLTSHKKPIVLLEKKKSYSLSDLVAPGINQVGLFLAPTPLHHLLLQKSKTPLVATSANLSGEPICCTFEEIMKLSGVWDYVVDNDREIINPCDDSIAFVENETTFLLRNARGYTPSFFRVPSESDKKALCLGANQKSSVALVHSGKAILSPYLGDLDSLPSIERFKSQIETLKKTYDFEPEVIVCDKHPNYESTKYALELKKENPKLEMIQVQHHYAHILSTMGINNIHSKVLGVSFDGNGYGDDGTLWGGEFLVCDRNSYERVVHFKNFKLIGAGQAIKEPRRVALSFLFDIYGDDVFNVDNHTIDSFSLEEITTLYNIWKKNINSPLSSSCGRLFDSVASILNIVQISSFDGESGLLLESLYNEKYTESYKFEINNGEIDFSPIFIQILEDTDKKEEVVSKFFNTLVEIIYAVSKIYNLPVALGGGVFQNRVLIRLIMKKIPAVLIAKEFLSNDGAISYGQSLAISK